MRIWINDRHAGRRGWLNAIRRTVERARRVREFNLPGAMRSRIANRFVEAIQNKVPWGKISWTEQYRYYVEHDYRGMYGRFSHGGPEYYGRINPQERLTGHITGGPESEIAPAGGPRFLEGMYGRFRTRHAGADVYVGTMAVMNPYAEELPTAPIMRYFDEGWYSTESPREMKPRPVRWWIAKQFAERLRGHMVETWRQALRPLLDVNK